MIKHQMIFHVSRRLASSRTFVSLAKADESIWSQDYDDLILIRRENVAFIALNRPKKLNALSFDMIKNLNFILEKVCNDPTLNCFAMDSCMKGHIFCAGGDVKDLFRESTKNNSSEPGEPRSFQGNFFREEFTMNYLLSEMPDDLPQISIWDGSAFGGGVGLSLHGRFRVATENARVAMPEVHIGLFPDDGTSFFYGHLPKGIGNYLSLTGNGVIGAPALVKYGFATHAIHSRDIPSMLDTLVEASKDNLGKVEEVLDSYHDPDMDGPEDIIDKHRDEIDDIFDTHGDSIENIFRTLENRTNTSDFARKTLDTMKKLPPTALKVSLEMTKRGRLVPTVGDALVTEYRVIEKCIKRRDFHEGVYAKLIDRKYNPQWNPSSLEDITEKDIAELFYPLDKKEYELRLPSPPLHAH